LGRFSQCNREQARASLGIGRDEFAVVWAARLVPVKDVELLAAVIKKAAESSHKFRFLIVGDGTERARFESLIAGCNNVSLLGWRTDMETVWAAADAALLTSRNEGTPTALIEAMAARVPFVATNVGAVQDIAIAPLQELPDAKGSQAGNGFLTARTAEAIMYCLETLVGDAGLAQQMGEEGHNFVMDRFSTSRLMAELTALYRALLQGKYGVIAPEAESSAENRSKAADAI
jgi:glycosyltransferase involved in cell wall biosynthesis